MVKFFREHEPSHIYGHQYSRIAKGSFGSVYKTTNDYAIKITKNNCVENGENHNFLREVLILRSLNHPNILKLLAISKVENKSALYMELAVETFDECMSRNEMTKTEKIGYLYQLLRALEYCHTNHIIHRDVKPENILLFNGKLQLADFGLSRPFISSGDTHTGEVVTIWWRAPELLLGKTYYSYEVDIWSVGVIMFTLCTGKYYFQGSDEMSQLHEIYKVLGTPNENSWPGVTCLPNWRENFSECPKMDFDLDSVESELLYKLLAWCPDRISATEALFHPYFDTVRDFIEEKYPHTLTVELSKYPSKTSFDQRLRYVLFDWLWVLRNLCKFRYDTLFMAYRIFDQYLEHKQTIPKRQIQGYGMMCLFIASKILEIDLGDIEDYIDISLNIYTADQLILIEKDILITLDYTLLFQSRPFSHILKNEYYAIPSERLMTYLTALHLNYDWITTWSTDESLTILQQYVNEEDFEIKDTLQNYFNRLTGEIGRKIKNYESK